MYQVHVFRLNVLADSDLGAISRFGRRNPIYRMPNTNTGVGASVNLSEATPL